MPVIAGTLTSGVVVGLFTTVPALRQHILKYLPNLPHGSTILKVLLAISVLLNFKALPLVWHFRVFRAIFYQIQVSKNPMTQPHLFKPMVTSSYNAIYECDYNGHKSNSTYFADLDVSRAHFVGALFRTSLKRMNAGDYEGLPPKEQIAAAKSKGKESYFIALGGVACIFRKEIKPLEQFEIWTRLLSWDNKWLYIVSHVVKKGSIKPTGYHMQPWKQSKARKSGKKFDAEDKEMTRNIFATSISKYVCKKGRLTIAPALLLERSRLLPPKPQSNGGVSDSTVLVDTSDVSSTGTPSNLTSPENMGLAAEAVSARLGASGTESSDSKTEDQPMTWDEVEAERLRGMEIAKHFDGLTALQDEFGKSDEVLGKYSDFLW